MKIGRGIPYSGYGTNIEAGINNIGAYLSIGYETAKNPIKASTNFGTGIRFYDNMSNYFNIRYGLHAGWVNNYYYDNALKNTNYNPNVYGISLLGGGEFSFKYILFDFDATLSPSFAIFNSKTHPYYRSYFGLSAGIGFNFGNIKFHKKKPKYKEIKKENLPSIH
jgi:hypothetical protein